jgi:hypothetical protein
LLINRIGKTPCTVAGECRALDKYSSTGNNMLYSNDRHQMRQVFVNAWTKFQNKSAMEPLEKMICDVIVQHPEYQAIIENVEQALTQDFSPEMGEINPFMHMGLHIAIHEQLSVDRPPGVRDIYQQLQHKLKDNHEVEHRMMECLGEMMWQAQRNNTAPDEQIYLKELRNLIQKKLS